MGGEIRTGCQYPTQSYILPFEDSYGADAVDLYEESGREAMEWQENLVDAILAHDDAGIFMHIKFGYSVPRQNGKNEVITMVEVWALEKGLKVLHTAHRTDTAGAAYQRLEAVMRARGYSDKPEGDEKKCKFNRTFGREAVILPGGGEVTFRTRTGTGGLGTSYDILIIDEAQEYQDDHESALKYVIAAAPNPLTIMLGTPPTPQSSGTVFAKFRRDVLRGTQEASGWCEWSVESETDVLDRDAWYMTNPSLGLRLQERTIRSEASPDDQVDFNVQRLGYWIQYSQKSVISKTEWKALQADKLPELSGKLHIGIKYARDGSSVVMALGIKLDDGRVFVEVINRADRREGDAWILNFLRGADYDHCVVDGAVGRQVLEKEMIENRLRTPLMMTTGEAIAAFASFETAISNNGLVHMGQPALERSATNVDHRAIGTAGGFGYRSLKEGIDVTIMEAVAIAYWLAATSKPRRKQRAIY